MRHLSKICFSIVMFLENGGGCDSSMSKSLLNASEFNTSCTETTIEPSKYLGECKSQSCSHAYDRDLSTFYKGGVLFVGTFGFSHQ